MTDFNSMNYQLLFLRLASAYVVCQLSLRNLSGDAAREVTKSSLHKVAHT
jgi:hypothetical protein